MRRRVLLALLALVGASVGEVHAQEQPWLADRRSEEGIGLRAGEFELHPGLALEAGYDSNYYQRAPAEGVIPSLRLRLIPSLSLSTLGPQRRGADGSAAALPAVRLRATAAAAYSEFLGLSGVPDESRRLRQQRHLSGGLSLRAELRPEQPLGGELLGDYRRIAQPSNSPDGLWSFNRQLLRLGGAAVWRPGGGTLDWRLGYEFRYHHFEAPAHRLLSNVEHLVKTSGRWRFLPRTAVLHDTELGLVDFPSPNNWTLRSSRPVRSRLGLSGLVTYHFAFLAMAGWGASFHQGQDATTEDFDGVIGQGELRWFLHPQVELPAAAPSPGLSSVAVGVTRDFGRGYLSDYYTHLRGYASVSYLLGGVFVFDAEAAWNRIDYPRSYLASNVDRDGDGVRDLRKVAFGEQRIELQLFGEYRLSDRFGIHATGRYNSALDGAAGAEDNVVLNEVTGQVDDLAFARVEVLFGARWSL